MIPKRRKTDKAKIVSYPNNIVYYFTCPILSSPSSKLITPTSLNIHNFSKTRNISIFQQAFRSDNFQQEKAALMSLIEICKEKPLNGCDILEACIADKSTIPAIHDVNIMYQIAKMLPSYGVCFYSKVLMTDDVELIWQATKDILKLANKHPSYFIPLISSALDSDNPHVQWISMINLVFNVKQFATLIEPILENVHHKHIKIFAKQKKYGLRESLSSESFFSEFSNAIHRKDESHQWSLLVKLLQTANISLQSLKHIFKCASFSTSLHVRYFISLIISQKIPDFTYSKMFKSYGVPFYYEEKNILRLINHHTNNLACNVIVKAFPYLKIKNQLLALYEIFQLYKNNQKRMLFILNKLCKTNL